MYVLQWCVVRRAHFVVLFRAYTPARVFVRFIICLLELMSVPLSLQIRQSGNKRQRMGSRRTIKKYFTLTTVFFFIIRLCADLLNNTREIVYFQDVFDNYGSIRRLSVFILILNCVFNVIINKSINIQFFFLYNNIFFQLSGPT